MYSIIITKIISKNKCEVVFESTVNENTNKVAKEILLQYLFTIGINSPYTLSFEKHNIWNVNRPFEYLFKRFSNPTNHREYISTQFHVNFKEIINK